MTSGYGRAEEPRPTLGPMTEHRSLLEMAAATPADRDRYVDFLRAFSILVVVLGHWLIAVVEWRGGRVDGTNALEVIPGLWLATWILQVMPVFFFVGGFANLRTLRATRRADRGYAPYLHGRLVRMMRPTVVFLGLGSVVTVTLDALNVADNVVFPASQLITRPLWFLGVYMIVVAVSPPMITLHERFGARVVVALAVTAVAIDVARFGIDLTPVGYVNYPVVWLLAHQLGFLYADGSITASRARWLAGAGLAAMVALVNLGPYPGSMVGLSTDEFSNMDPPTVAIVALTLWQVGLAMLARGRVSRWLARLRPWAGVIFVNSVIMTVFLWHLTAMLLGIGMLYPLGFPQPRAGSVQWWLLRPAWVAVLAVLLALFVLAFGRFEQRSETRAHPAAPSPPSVICAALGVVFVVMGVLGFAMGGMHQLFSVTGTELIVFSLNPFHNILHLMVGGLFIWGSVRSREAMVTAGVVGILALGAMAAAGFWMAAHPEANHLAANGADNVLHLAAIPLAAFVALGRNAVVDPGPR